MCLRVRVLGETSRASGGTAHTPCPGAQYTAKGGVGRYSSPYPVWQMLAPGLHCEHMRCVSPVLGEHSPVLPCRSTSTPPARRSTQGRVHRWASTNNTGHGARTARGRIAQPHTNFQTRAHALCFFGYPHTGQRTRQARTHATANTRMGLSLASAAAPPPSTCRSENPLSNPQAQPPTKPPRRRSMRTARAAKAARMARTARTA